MSSRRLPGLTVAPGTKPGIPDAAMSCDDREFMNEPLRVLAGELPEGLRGHVFISGPKATRGEPVWGAEAVLWRLDFHGGGVRLSKRFPRNPAWYAQEAITKEDWFGCRRRRFEFTATGANIHLSMVLGVQDAQNIAPIPLRDDLMLLSSDNGRPWLICPLTMDLLRPMGDRSDWKPSLPSPQAFATYATTAHAVLDQDGWLYSTNFMPKAPVVPGFTHLVRWQVDTAAMEHFRLIDGATGEPLVMDMTIHQLEVTDRYVVLLESAFRVNLWLAVLHVLHVWGVPESVLDSLTDKPDYPFARFWVVAKADLAQGGPPSDPPDVVAKPFSIGGESFHFLAAYDDSESLDLFVLHTPLADIAHQLSPGEPMLDGGRAREALDGWFVNGSLVPAELGLHRIDVDSGSVDSKYVGEREHTWSLDVHAYRYLARPWNRRKMPRIFMTSGGFYSVDMPLSFIALYRARAPRTAELPTAQKGSVLSFDPRTLAIDGWPKPDGWLSWTPTYLPAMKEEDGRWVEDPDAPDTAGHLCVIAVSDPTDELPEGSSGVEFWIFEAGDLAKGPVCRLGMPGLQLGVAVHSCWVEKLLRYDHGPEYDVRADYDLSGIRADYESLVPSWALGQRLWKRLVRRVIQWDRVEALFEERIYPKFTDRKR